MGRKYIKRDQVIKELNDGSEIYTSRRQYSRSHTILTYELWKGESVIGYIHSRTMNAMIDDKTLQGLDAGHDKYKLSTTKQGIE